MAFPPFVTPADIAARLGKTFSTVQQVQVQAFCEDASEVLRDYVQQNLTTAAGIPFDIETPVPGVVHTVCARMVMRAMDNPLGMTSGESIDDYKAPSYASAGTGCFLSDEDKASLQRFRRNSFTVSMAGAPGPAAPGVPWGTA